MAGTLSEILYLLHTVEGETEPPCHWLLTELLVKQMHLRVLSSQTPLRLPSLQTACAQGFGIPGDGVLQVPVIDNKASRERLPEVQVRRVAARGPTSLSTEGGVEWRSGRWNGLNLRPFVQAREPELVPDLLKALERVPNAPAVLVRAACLAQGCTCSHAAG